MSLIHLNSASRNYETEDADAVGIFNIDLDINPGEFVCVNGPSGSGKSTLLNIIGSLDRPDEGSYFFDGQDVSSLDDSDLAYLRRHMIGFIYQHHGLEDSLTALQNVEIPAIYAGVDPHRRKSDAEARLISLGLSAQAGRRPAQLSGGERQRVALARALMNSPRVLVADEPTGALDSSQGEEVLDCLERLSQQGCTVVVASHSNEVAARATRNIKLCDGQISRDSGASPDIKAGQNPMAGSQIGALPSSCGFSGLIRMAFYSLRQARIRMALVSMVSILATASAIALIGIAEGTYTQFHSTMGELGANRINIGPPLSAVVNSSSIPQPPPRKLDVEDIRAMRGLPNIRQVFGSLGADRLVRHAEKSISNVFVHGQDERPMFRYKHYPLARGSFMTPEHSSAGANVAVINPLLSDMLFSASDEVLGSIIYIGGHVFEIIGVFDEHPILKNHPDLLVGNLPSLQIPFATALRLGFDSGFGATAAVCVSDPGEVQRTVAELRDLLTRRHPGHRFSISAANDELAPMRDANALRVTIFAAVAMIVLLTSAFTVVVVMLSAVQARRREIAIRTSLGARRKHIYWQFLVEASMIALIGVAVGVPLAILLSPFSEAVFGTPWTHNTGIVLLASGTALTVGILSGVIPANRASRIDPARVLSEP